MGDPLLRLRSHDSAVVFQGSATLLGGLAHIPAVLERRKCCCARTWALGKKG
jgi:hypothetical protein